MDVEHDGIRTPVIQSSRKLEPSKVHAGASRHFPEYGSNSTIHTILYNSFGTHGQSAVTKSHRKVTDVSPMLNANSAWHQ